MQIFSLQVKSCHHSELRLRRTGMLFSTKSKGPKSKFRISWMCRFCFYDLKVHFWWPNKLFFWCKSSLNTLYNQVKIKKLNIPIQNEDKQIGEGIKTVRKNQCKKRSLYNSKKKYKQDKRTLEINSKKKKPKMPKNQGKTQMSTKNQNQWRNQDRV